MTDQVRILDGSTFLVSDGNGDIDPSPTFPTGLFSTDTRYLSKWVLTVNGERLNALSVDDLQYFEARFFLVPGVATHYIDAKLSVIRRRLICGLIEEHLSFLNHNENEVELTIRVEAGCDFADLFEIKDVTEKKGEYYRQVEDGCLRLGYRRGEFRRETVIEAGTPAEVDEDGFTFTVSIPPHGEWDTCLKVRLGAVAVGGIEMHPDAQRDMAAPQMRADLEQWINETPAVNTESESLAMTYKRSLVDLAALRFRPMTSRDESIPAAGLPWFMTIFGRDSIFTSLQTLPFVPAQAAATLRLLASLQGTRFDDFRDEDPGRILHEFRYGETAAFEEQPHSPYYGAADATPLWVILLDEYERWSGDHELVAELEYAARAALKWVDTYADLMGNGYIWYEPRKPDTGLENQCWKDSWDAIAYRDGRLPGFPRATCELQGYAYDAKLRAARLARLVWNDPGFADQLEREAEELKARFNRDFWVADGEYYALSLDSEGGQVDSLTSNIGHLLWSGIVPEDRAKKIAEHLVGPRLFSGWGVRTMAVGEGRYNPIGYHVGTVWPFDSSFIAWGLRRYGFIEEAAKITEGLLDAAAYFQGRLPEAFGGYDREQTRYPVEYPTACSPQAWSTGTPLLLIRNMLGLDPHEDHLAVNPGLPRDMGRIEVLDIPGRWGRTDAFARGRLAVQHPKTASTLPRLT
ncbi:MAG TPA: glycogen debranching N-terminal domain-containing protein [Micromonosporaceae bacterium]|nr:glycogen debranching N-terminal domain-containing protein [Micromonosporaceae bacterium]